MTSSRICLARLCIMLAAEVVAAPAHAQALDKVSFGTNWVAEAEHGGFYQALADGTYRKYGLDVTIVPGGRVPHAARPLRLRQVDGAANRRRAERADARRGDLVRRRR